MTSQPDRFSVGAWIEPHRCVVARPLCGNREALDATESKSIEASEFGLTQHRETSLCARVRREFGISPDEVALQVERSRASADSSPGGLPFSGKRPRLDAAVVGPLLVGSNPRA